MIDVIIFAVMIAIIGLAALWNYNVRQEERSLLLESMAAESLATVPDLYFLSQCLVKAGSAKRHAMLKALYLHMCQTIDRKPSSRHYIHFLQVIIQWK